MVIDHVLDALSCHFGKSVIGIHRGRMVAPDHHVFDIGHSFAGFSRQLAERSVVVQAQHGGEVFSRQIGGAFHGDIGIGIGRVTHYQYAHIAASNGVECLALCGEYLCIDCEQFGTFHAGATRTRADQECVVHIFESRQRVAMRLHTN